MKGGNIFSDKLIIVRRRIVQALDSLQAYRDVSLLKEKKKNLFIYIILLYYY